MNNSERIITEVDSIKRIVAEQKRRVRSLFTNETTFVSWEREILTKAMDKLMVAEGYLEQL